jgi:hypothetical protein
MKTMSREEARAGQRPSSLTAGQHSGPSDRQCAYSDCVESPVTLFFGSTCTFPVSNQSTDLPNSRLIARRTANWFLFPAFQR